MSVASSLGALNRRRPCTGALLDKRPDGAGGQRSAEISHRRTRRRQAFCPSLGLHLPNLRRTDQRSHLPQRRPARCRRRAQTVRRPCSRRREQRAGTAQSQPGTSWRRIPFRLVGAHGLGEGHQRREARIALDGLGHGLKLGKRFSGTTRWRRRFAVRISPASRTRLKVRAPA